MTDKPTTRALFASVRDALVFALNFEDSSIPGPLMNREMAAVAELADTRGGNAPKLATVAMDQTDARPSPRRRNVPLGGVQDRAVVAGWVLLRLSQLELLQQTVLRAMLVRPKRPCECRSACCRGWTIRADWVAAVQQLADYFKSRADETREPGKRGFSSDPRLRVALIEDYCRGEGRRASISDLCRQTDASSVTVAKHRELIHGHLKEIEDRAWEEVAVLLDAVGITGSLDGPIAG